MQRRCPATAPRAHRKPPPRRPPPTVAQAPARRYQGRDGRLGIRHTRNVQLSAQGHDTMTIACAGTQLYTRHDRRPLATVTGAGSGPSGSLLKLHLEHMPQTQKRPGPIPVCSQQMLNPSSAAKPVPIALNRPLIRACQAPVLARRRRRRPARSGQSNAGRCPARDRRRPAALRALPEPRA